MITYPEYAIKVILMILLLLFSKHIPLANHHVPCASSQGYDAFRLSVCAHSTWLTWINSHQRSLVPQFPASFKIQEFV